MIRSVIDLGGQKFFTMFNKYVGVVNNLKI